MLDDMDEEQVRQMLNNFDEEQLAEGAGALVDHYLVPELEDVRARAQSAEDAKAVRNYYENELTAEEREEEFYHALDKLVGTLVECRERPQTGLPKLKTQLRDPFTLEALLLIFGDEDHIDPEHTAELKKFAAIHAKWIGAMLLPEMYNEAERQQVIDQMDLEPDPDTDGFSS